MDAKCRWRCCEFQGTPWSNKSDANPPGETINHQGAITHGLCCLAAQYKVPAWKEGWVMIKVSNLPLSKILNKGQNSIFYEFHKKTSFPQIFYDCGKTFLIPAYDLVYVKLRPFFSKNNFRIIQEFLSQLTVEFLKNFNRKSR